MLPKHYRYLVIFLIFSLFTIPTSAETPLSARGLTSTPGLRACCAFGYDLELPIVPLIRLNNVLSIDELLYETHAYGGSIFESNGLIYTCRGGFIDSSHLRDVADWTAFLAVWLKNNYFRETVVALPDQGTKAIRLELNFRGRKLSDETIIRLAQRISFEYSMWHEIATWYGYSFAQYFQKFFSEKVSAFTPEDIYSNLVGAYVGGLALQKHNSYGMATRIAIRNVFKGLYPVGEAGTRRAFDVVKNTWWHPERNVADNELVTRRYVEFGKSYSPWLVPGSIKDCDGIPKEAVSLQTPEFTAEGESLTSLYKLVFYPDRKILKTLPVAKHHSPTYLTAGDFSWVMEHARRSVRSTFGERADQPDF